MNQTVSDYIIDLLAQGAVPTKALVVRAMKKKAVTKEAVYKALRHMLREEVVVKRGKSFSLSNQWILKMSEKWRSVENRYLGKTTNTLLERQGSAVYTVKTLDQLDALWNHYIFDFVSLLPVTTPLFFYTPHYWFPAIRSATEEEVTHTVTSRGYHWMQLAGKTKILDVTLEKYFPQKEIDYFAASVKEPHNVTVLGDYIIDVAFDKKVRDFIDAWYEKNTTFTPETISELQKALKIPGIHKLKISKNKKRATEYRKLFSKYFVFK